MRQRPRPKRTAAMLQLLGLLCSACASNSPPRQPVPPLPTLARQPAQPSQCLPTCSANAASEFERWLNTLTGQGEQDRPAKPLTTL